jgi:hypothetical protein
MKQAKLVPSFAIIVTCFCAPSLAQTTSDRSVSKALSALGVESIRGINTDICYPATASEYQAMGKNAILMVSADTAIATELPLRSVYITHRGVRIPLQRVAILKKDESSAEKASQISFYLLPIHYMKLDAKVAADFKGDRLGFGFMTFESENKPESMPTFARLDEYDFPQEPDLAIVGQILEREYPDQANEIR